MASATGLIAKESRPSEATVKRHLAIVYQEVGVHSSNAVVRAALVGQRAATEPTPLAGPPPRARAAASVCRLW